LIAKWEDRVRQRGAKIIRLELKREIKGHIQNINLINSGGENIGADAYGQPKIQKVIPKEERYDPVKHNLFFKNAIDIFKNVPIPEVVENPPRSSFQPNLVKSPTSPPTPMNYTITRKHPDQCQSVINLWFQLFFDILGEEQLIEKLCNTLYLILGNEGTS
jgi:hypothetical protein